jgi:Leucine-rich repeat (LRR) protein
MKELVIENCPQIKKLNVNNNHLTSLKFLESLENSERLDLDISSNNFSENDLRLFNRITNLHGLNLGNPLTRNIF